MKKDDVRNSSKNFIKKNWLISTIVLIFLTWIIYSYFSQGLIFAMINSDYSKMISFINSFGIFAGIAFVILVILEVVLAPIPPLVLYLVAGVLFGGFWGGILTLIGNLIGAWIDFGIARRYAKKNIERNSDKKIKKKFDKFFGKYGALSIFILRVNPITTSDLVSYLSGLTKIKTWKFLLATGLGLIPLIFIQTYLGDVIKENQALLVLTIIFSALYLIIFIYLLIVALKKKN